LNNEATREGRAAFERLYMAHAAAVRRHLAYLTGDSSLAEDLTQEAFGKLYQHDRASSIRNPKSWLVAVASNLAYNHFRSESRRTAREFAQAVPALAHTAPQIAVDDVIDVRRALRDLEPRDRTALMLRHSGFSYIEVAEAIGVSATSVGTILARAQARFRSVYEGERRPSAEKE
jgi:RNA polymerase sigma factor (sigma-70 family)